ncbi:VCBS repeat-containing protein [Lentzea sp. NPDC006480]|uniref:FG-GAP repeat domain-containing protein n=1 Tax=Lentzea sp. NPDC006480 TaxID=3157176 RepID=UPI0033A65845
MRRTLSVLALLGLLSTLITTPAQAIGYAPPPSAWTHVNKLEPDTSYWETHRDAVRVGAIDGGQWRSLFQFDTRQFAGARIIDATVRIMIDRTESCDETPVDLWQTKTVDPAKPLTWRTSEDHWSTRLASGSGQACAQYNMPLALRSDQLRQVVQEAADRRDGSMGFGLRAPQDTDPAQGKVILHDSVFLVVTYNNAPSAPTVSTTYPRACGTADAPTVMPPPNQFSGSAKDLDDDNLTTTLEIRDAAGTTVHTSDVYTGSGARFSWAELPSGLLQHGNVYSYRAKTSDGTDSSPYSTECWLLVDGVRPGKPRVSSTDYPNGQSAIPAGTTGTITLSPATAGDDVYGYQFGLQQEKATTFVKAGPDGRAVIPVTMPRDQRTSFFYARAVDRAGNVSDYKNWDLFARAPVTPQPHVRADYTGDGRADVTFMERNDFGRYTMWNVTARDGGFHSGTQVFDPGISSGPEQWGPHVRGDFDGDGRSDVIMFQRNGANTRMLLMLSDGNRLNAPPIPWTGELPLDSTRLTAGDFDGDGKTDVAAATGSRVQVFRGGALGTPTTWLDGVSGKISAGDFDGDGKDDLAEIRSEGTGSSLRTYASTGSGFGAGEVRWQGNDYPADSATPISADVDGDGRGDVVVVGEQAVFVHTAANFTPRMWSQGKYTGVVTAGDFDLDGKEDLAVVGAANGKTQLWTLRSTGSAFDFPVLGWEDETRGTPSAS